MNTHSTLSTIDFSRLMPLVATPAARVAKNTLERLDDKLANANVVEPQQMRPDVVTMNSKVLLASPAWQSAREYRLVYPGPNVCPTGDVSVLSVLGAELLGAQIGARFSLGSGPTYRVVELVGLSYQPEAAGQWEL